MATAFPRDKQLTAISIAFKNPDASLIAEHVFPRSPVGTEVFEYTVYPTGQGFTIPKSLVGTYGRVERVQISGSKVQGATEDHGYEIPVSNKDIKQAPPGVDPRARATEQGTNLLLLDREVRAAEIAFNPANYGFKTTLAGANRWSDPTSKPLTAIWNAMSVPIMRPNIAVVGREAWNFMATHPDIVSAALGNDGTKGICPPERLAEILGLSAIYIGDARYNINKPGKPPSLAFGWGKHFLLAYRDRTASTQGGLTFGLTFEYDSRFSGSKDDADMGLRGGVVVKTGESVVESVIAPDCAYFFESVVA